MDEAIEQFVVLDRLHITTKNPSDPSLYQTKYLSSCRISASKHGKVAVHE
jgi:hypothetical protein